MAFRIVRTDITKMNTQAVVNTANSAVVVGQGCDSAIYKAAGIERLLEYRSVNVGEVPEGEAFVTPGFDLEAEYIIHVVSPVYTDGEHGEEDRLRSCYRNVLGLALEYGIRSVAFPLISTGSFGYPKEEGMRIAVDEINAFLLGHDMLIYLVVFGENETRLGERLQPGLEEYIDRHYVEKKKAEEYRRSYSGLKLPSFLSKADKRRKALSAEKSEKETGSSYRDNSAFLAAGAVRPGLLIKKPKILQMICRKSRVYMKITDVMAKDRILILKEIIAANCRNVCSMYPIPFQSICFILSGKRI